MKRTAHPVIAALEILGGLWAAGGSIWMAGAGMGSDWGLVLTFVGGLAAAYAGLQLWRGHPKGRRLSLRIQAIQLIQIAVPGVAFVAVLGPSIPIGYRNGALRITAEIEEGAYVAVWHHKEPPRFELNLLALGLLVRLSRHRGAESDVPEVSSAPEEAPAV